MQISDRLRAKRQELDKTQEEVAREAEMNVTQYNGYERGRSVPSSVTLPRLAKALHTTSEILLGHDSTIRQVNGEMKSRVIHRIRNQFRAQIATELDLAPENIIIRIEFV